MRRLGPLLLSIALLACGEDGGLVRELRPEPELTDPIARQGGRLYHRYCSLCHGSQGEGYAADDAPALTGPEWLRTASDEFITAAIVQGRPGTAMSAWHRQSGGPLAASDIEAIVRYLRAWQQGPRARVDHLRVQGDAPRGRVIYAEYCVACHGARGDGVGAPSLANPTLLATASDGFLQYAVTHGRSGTRMLAFAGTLTPQQIGDVVRYVRSFSPEPRADAQIPPVQAPEPPPPPELPNLADMELVIHPDGPRPRFTLREERYVPAAQVERELGRGARMIIIDARPTSDWLRSRIPGAIPMPYYDLSGILADLPRDGTWMLAYCGCPHAASGRVVDALREHGFTNTAVIDEGIHHWEQQGYRTASGPLEEEPSAAPPRVRWGAP